MKAHRTDGVSLTFGLTFLAIVAWWLLAQILHLPLPAVGWFLAGALILIGVFGLLGALRSGRAAPAATPTPVPDEPLPAEPVPADELSTGPLPTEPLPAGEPPTDELPARDLGGYGGIGDDRAPTEPVTGPSATGAGGGRS